MATPSSPKSVLILEDDKATLRLLALIIEDSGFEVRTCATCTEAAKILEVWRPAVALLDYWLEDETCQPVAARLKQLGVPYALITASSYGSMYAAQVEANAFLAKPFFIEDLMKTVIGLLSREVLKNF